MIDETGDGFIDKDDVSEFLSVKNLKLIRCIFVVIVEKILFKALPIRAGQGATSTDRTLR